jgi:outer membrane receptor protein involved in Fe transport
MSAAPRSPEIHATEYPVEKPATLAELLSRVAGVHVDQVGGRGGTGSLYMRGADPNYTLVLVDGVRVNDPTNARGGSFDFSGLDVADVDAWRSRAGRTAVYGGDALAGVINIVTRHAPAEKGYASADAMGGAYDAHEISVNTGGPVAGGDWNMGFSDSHEGEQVRGNEFDAQRISGSFDFGSEARPRSTSRALFGNGASGFSRRQRRLRMRRSAMSKTRGEGEGVWRRHHAPRG